MYFYKQKKDGKFVVGYYDLSGDFIPESDWNTRKEAAERVHYLNCTEDCDE